MNIEKLKNKKNECRAWKNVAPWYNELQNAQKIEKKDLKVDFWATKPKSLIITPDQLTITK